MTDAERASFEAQLEAMATGYLPGAVLAAAVELGVFEALDEPRDEGDVARIVGADPDGVGRLLRALVALGIAQRDEAGVYRCPHADTLRLDSSSGIGALFVHHRRHVAPLFGQLPAVLRAGALAHGAWDFASVEPAPGLYDELTRHPAEFALFMRAMDRGSRGVGKRIAELEDLTECRSLLDLGGGGGAVARELLAAVPGLKVESIDLGPACRYARAAASSAGLGARHDIREGDLRALPEDIEPADVVLLSGVLADFPPRERALVVGQAASRVRPEGRLLVSETLLDPRRTSPAPAALLSLMTYAAFGGDQLSLDEVVSLFASVDVRFVSRHRAPHGGRDLVVGRAPAA